MTTLLFAQPYNICADGFYFLDFDEYLRKFKGHVDRYGQAVEEYEIQFIDGEEIDADLAKAWEVNQANLRNFFRVVQDWSEDDKIRFIIAVGECGYRFDPETVEPDDFDVDLYAAETMKELAAQFIDEGLFGEVPKPLEFYIDYEAIARDLGVDYSETVIGGQTLIYRCG